MKLAVVALRVLGENSLLLSSMNIAGNEMANGVLNEANLQNTKESEAHSRSDFVSSGKQMKSWWQLAY